MDPLLRALIGIVLLILIVWLIIELVQRV